MALYLITLSILLAVALILVKVIVETYYQFVAINKAIADFIRLLFE